MKKIITAALALITLLTGLSCTVENPVQPQFEGETLDFFADFITDEVKTTMDINGKTTWSTADLISISNGQQHAPFKIAKLSPDARHAHFTGTLPKADRYWALYPSQTDLQWANDKVIATLPPVQQAVAGSFADGASLAVAAVENQSMHFKNVGALLGIGIQEDGIKNIRLESLDGTPLAGKVKITIGQVPAVQVTAGVAAIDLKANFVNGKTYYMTVLPGRHAKGFKLTFYKADGKTAELKASKPLTLDRNSNILLFNMKVPAAKWADHYILVKDAAKLEAGDIVRIGVSTQNIAAGALTKKDGLGGVAATFAKGEMTSAEALDFTLGTGTNGWLLTAKDGNLGASSKTSLAYDVKNKDWTITTDADGNADVVATSGRLLLYSIGSTLFKNYSDQNKTNSEYALVQLYKKATSIEDLGITPGTTPDPGTDPTPDPGTDPTPQPADPVWKLVKNAGSLKAGDHLKIGCPTQKVAAGALKSNALTGETASFTGDVMEAAAATDFTLGGTVGNWTLMSTNGKLGAQSDGTKMYNGTGATTWSIAIDAASGNAEISAGSGRCILVSNSSTIFKHYASSNIGGTSYSEVQLYRLEGSTAPGPNPDPNPNPDPTPQPDPTPGQPANGQTKWLEMPGTQLVGNPGMYCVTHHAKMNGKNQRNYSLLYDSNMLTSYWVAYPLCKGHMGTGRNEKWSFDPKIPQEKQTSVKSGYKLTISTPNYSNNSYARGHQIPNADRSGVTDMVAQTYYSTNMTPQIQYGFNGYLWVKLEEEARAAVISDTLYMVTGATFNKVGENVTVKKVKNGNDGKMMPVPNYYWKVMLKVKRGGPGNITSAKAAAFWLPHQDLKGHVYTEYETTVDQVEAWTGFDFFVNLPEELQKKAEAQKDWAGFSTF